MLFNKELIDKVLDVKKTMTSRCKQICEVREVTNLMANRDFSKISGKYIKITAVYQKALGEFTDGDGKKEGFENLVEFKAYLKKNSKKLGEWNPDKVVWVHEFEVLEPN